MARLVRFEEGDLVEVTLPATHNTPAHQTFGTVADVKPLEFKVVFDEPWVHDGKEQLDGWFRHGDKAVVAAEASEEAVAK